MRTRVVFMVVSATIFLGVLAQDELQRSIRSPAPHRRKRIRQQLLLAALAQQQHGYPPINIAFSQGQNTAAGGGFGHGGYNPYNNQYYGYPGNQYPGNHNGYPANHYPGNHNGYPGNDYGNIYAPINGPLYGYFGNRRRRPFGGLFAGLFGNFGNRVGQQRPDADAENQHTPQEAGVPHADLSGEIQNHVPEDHGPPPEY